jgi:hypothetical protein
MLRAREGALLVPFYRETVRKFSHGFQQQPFLAAMHLQYPPIT